MQTECRVAANAQTKPDDLGLSPPKIGSYHPHPPAPLSLLIIYRPTKGGRLGCSRHSSKGAQPVPKAVYRSSSRDKHYRLRRESNESTHSAVRRADHSATETVTGDTANGNGAANMTLRGD